MRRARARDDPFFGIQNQRAGKSRLVRCSARRVSNLNFEVLLLPHCTSRHRPRTDKRTHAHWGICIARIPERVPAEVFSLMTARVCTNNCSLYVSLHCPLHLCTTHCRSSSLVVDLLHILAILLYCTSLYDSISFI